MDRCSLSREGSARSGRRASGTQSRGRSRGPGEPAYLLTGLTRCSLCGGPLTVIGSRDGTTPIKAYVCAYRHDRGSAVCTNKHRRPIDSVNDLVMGWVEANVLSEEMVLDSLKKIRARLAVRAKQVTSEMPVLQGNAAKLKAEIANIVDVLAVTPKEHAAGLIAGMGERQVELTALEARIAATNLAPDSISFEVRRMEEEAKKLIADLRQAAELEPSKARELLVRIFDGKLTATPQDTTDGPRFLIEGIASLAHMRIVEGDPGQQKPPRNVRPYVDEFRTALVELAAVA